MLSKRSMRWALVFGILVAILAAPKPARAWSGCGPSYVVQWGDTLGSVADKCGVSVYALQQANPYIGDWLYAGQTVSIPDGYQGGGYYDGYQGGGYNDGYQGGGYYGGYQGPANCNDFQGSDCYGYQGGGNCGYQGGWNCCGFQGGSNCYGDGGCYGGKFVGSSGQSYVVKPGDTMRLIAERLGVSVCDLIRANPQIPNPSLIYAGQVLCLPAYNAQPSYFKDGHDWGHQSWGGKYGHWDGKNASNLYTVQAGEKLKEIAKKFDTTQEELLDLNPSLKGKPGNIYRGLVLVLW